jgi:hypothetical protein
MPNPNEIATITTASGSYQYWKSVEIERTVGNTISYMRFTAAEPGVAVGEVPSWGTLQLVPPMAAQTSAYPAASVAA